MRHRRGLGLVMAGVGLVAMVCLGLSASDYRIRWREIVIFDKVTGQLSEIGWPDLLLMLRPGSDAHLQRLAYNGNLFEVITSPRRSKDDLEAGEKLYRDHCSSCHGDQARGGLGGPSLHERNFLQGRSDLALPIARQAPIGLKAQGTSGN